MLSADEPLKHQNGMWQGDHQTGTLSQKQAAERNYLQQDPHPHPMNMPFYIQPLRPPISGNTSQPAEGVRMRVFCLLENKRRRDREKEPWGG